MASLTVANQQLTEIARALTMNAQLIIMNEHPTSSLSEHEVATLMGIIKDLRAEGVSILYISHKFEEIFEVSDRISVLRDGEYIGTMDTKDAELDEVLSMMVGRTVNIRFQKRTNEIGAKLCSRSTTLRLRGCLKILALTCGRARYSGYRGLWAQAARKWRGRSSVSTVSIRGR